MMHIDMHCFDVKRFAEKIKCTKNKTAFAGSVR